MLTYTAFSGFNRVAHGPLEEVALQARKSFKLKPHTAILIFSDSTGKQMDLDLQGTENEILERLKVYLPASEAPTAHSRAGRPRLGVVAREVSLLPAHWEWLSNQTGGASAFLRKLVDEKMAKTQSQTESIKQTQEVVYRFLSAIAGNLPQYEEAIRYLYRRDKALFAAILGEWPEDLARHTWDLAGKIFKDP